MDLKDLSKPLPIECIEFRVQSVNKGGYAVLLAYKDARVDMAVLDKVCGPCNWKREHSRDNKNCTVYIYCEKKKEWVGKEDTGTESYSDKNKGLASDSFKRACFNWGIGRELYDYPVMSVKLKSNEWKTTKDPKTGKEKAVTTWDFKLKEWAWVVKFDDKKQVTMLQGIDQNGAVRFSFASGKIGTPKAQQEQPKPEPPKTVNGKPIINDSVIPSIISRAVKEGKNISHIEKGLHLTDIQRKTIKEGIEYHTDNAPHVMPDPKG